MTIHEAIFSTVRQPLLGILYLLLTAQMALLLAAFRAGRSRRFRLVCLLHVLMSFFCLWMPFMDIDQNFFQTNVPALLPPARSGFTTLPAWVLFLYEALTALVLPVIFWDMHRFRMEHPTFSSIKETMDLLPAGIAYGKEDGTVVLSNLTMNRLSRAVTGKGLTDLNVFWEALPKEEADNGKAERRITLADGSGVWSVSSGPVIAAGGSFVQLTAAEITEQARVTRELEEKNQKLKDIHLRLNLYNRQADRIIIAQELLTARMAVHSEVGNVLLESRHYLTDPSSYDEEKLLRALKNTNTYLLREYEKDDTARDPLTDAVETAEAIGVDVVFSGPIPSADPCRSVLAAAIRECASNTVKHANGSRLTVESICTGDTYTFLMKSNGEAPQEEIRESGGLLSLRFLVENEGGYMQTASSPEFTLMIKMGRSAHDKALPGLV